jgi:uncharacterized integral membrane protein (TIGR00698 family)
VDLEKGPSAANVLARNDERSFVSKWGRVAIPLGFLISLYPGTTSAMALLLGVMLALTFGNPHIARTRKLTKPMLAWSIVGLGAGVNLLVVLKAGVDGVLFTMVSLSATMFIGTLIGRWLGIHRETSALINVGTAICGGSAIAAVSAAIRAKDDSTSVALGIVFILNAVGLIIFPSLGHWFDLSEQQFGLWGALAIHDTSSVVGATMQYGSHALEVGTTVKLVRALWIIPISILFAKFFHKAEEGSEKKAPTQYPWFIGGFVIMSAIVTWVEVLQPVGHQLEWLAKRALVATLFLIGSGLTLATLRKVGIKALVHGVALWIIVASVNLCIIRYG